MMFSSFKLALAAFALVSCCSASGSAGKASVGDDVFVDLGFEKNVKGRVAAKIPKDSDDSSDVNLYTIRMPHKTLEDLKSNDFRVRKAKPSFATTASKLARFEAESRLFAENDIEENAEALADSRDAFKIELGNAILEKMDNTPTNP